MQGQLIGDRSPAEFYFCDTAEAITVLVTSGYGVSVLPAFLVPDTPQLAKIPIADTESISFGIYYNSLQDAPALRPFIQCLQESFS